MKPTQNALSLLLISCLMGASSLGQSVPPQTAPVPPAPAASNVHTTDDVDVLRETQLQVRTKDHTGLIWWIPFEFWAQSAESNGSSPEKTREQFKTLRGYTIVGVLIGKFSALGSIEYLAPSELQKKTFLRDSEGKDYAALTDLSGDAKSLADMLKPLLANAMGRAGENFALLYFPATKQGGKPIADEVSKGSFSVVLKDIAGDPETVYLWRTPLTSFSAPRYCPVGKERVHADWDYCPRHGVKLDQP